MTAGEQLPLLTIHYQLFTIHYLDEQGETGTGFHLLDNLEPNKLGFVDRPNQRFVGDEYLSFTTALVGVLLDNTWDTLYTFSWKSNYNGKSGGVSIRSISPPDPGGTGGVFDLQLDLNPEDVPEEVRNLMTKDGSRNASLTIESPVTTPEPSTVLASVLFLGVSIFSKKGKKKQP